MKTASTCSRALTRLQRRRLSWRVAQGAPLRKAAERAGLDPATAEDLLSCPDFGQLLESYRAMVALPADERMRRLVEAALLVLEEAVQRKDLRATFFLLKQQLLGRNPAMVLAEGVVRALERQPAPPPEKHDPPPPAETSDAAVPRPVSMTDRAANAAAAALRQEMLDEVEALTDVPARLAPGWPAGGAQQESAEGSAPGWPVGGAQQAKPGREGRQQLDGIVWDAAALTRISDLRPLLADYELCDEQLILIVDEHARREQSGRDGASPETDPMNPNAPNC